MKIFAAIKKVLRRLIRVNELIFGEITVKFLIKLLLLFAGWVGLLIYANKATHDEQVEIAERRLNEAACRLNQCPDEHAEREVWEANQELCYARFGTPLPSETFEQWQACVHRICGRSTIKPPQALTPPAQANASDAISDGQRHF